MIIIKSLILNIQKEFFISTKIFMIILTALDIIVKFYKMIIININSIINQIKFYK